MLKHFKISTIITVIVVVAAGIAMKENNLAAVYIALVGGAVFYMLHVVEVKLNRLLDEQGVRIEQHDIDHPRY